MHCTNSCCCSGLHYDCVEQELVYHIAKEDTVSEMLRCFHQSLTCFMLRDKHSLGQSISINWPFFATYVHQQQIIFLTQIYILYSQILLYVSIYVFVCLYVSIYVFVCLYVSVHI